MLGSGDALVRATSGGSSRRAIRSASPARIGFDERLAHLIEGGRDMFLMPSWFEPCGLNQMYSLRYGTIPIVRATGGLNDTVMDADEAPDAATGLQVPGLHAGRAGLGASGGRSSAFRNPQRWKAMQRNGDGAGFSWDVSAREYVKVYRGSVRNPMASEKVQTLTDGNFDQTIGGGKPVLVDFWAEWCGPCRRLAPTVDELAGDYDGKVVVGKLNVDENPNTAFKFSIRGIPTLLLFKGGQVVEQVVGLADKDALKKVIDKHVA